MPVVPVDQNRVALAEGVSARQRAPDMSGTGLEALGRGMQQLGQAGQQYAATQDEIQAHADKIGARDAALRAQGEINGILGEYGQLAGKDASDSGAAYQKRIDDLKTQYLDKAGNPRQRQFLSDLLGERVLLANNAISEHSKAQLFNYTKGTYASGATLAQQSAVQFRDNPEQYEAAKAEGLGYLDKLGHMEGWDENTVKIKRQQFTSGIHESVLDTMKTATVPDIDAIKAYAEKHGGEMTLDARNNLQAWLQKPEQDRQLDSNVDRAIAGLKTSASEAGEASKGAAYQSPVAGGKVTSTNAQHEARGSKGLDIAAGLGSAIHPIAGGTVIPWNASADSGNYIAVRHADGSVSTYSHMGNVSVKVGDEVSADTVLGTVGMTGHTTGPHVHLRVRDADGKDVDPEKVLGTKPAITSGSTTARNYDQAAVIANINAMNLSPEEKRLTIQRAEQRMRESESLYADQQQDLGQKVHKWVGDWMTQHGDYPPATAIPSWASGWDGLSELKGDLTQRQKAKTDKAVAEQQNWTALQATLRMYNDPIGFRDKADIPKEYMGKVSLSQYAEIVTAQARMRAEASKPQAWNPFEDSNKALNNYLMLNPPSSKLQDSQKATALQTIKGAIEAAVDKKKAPLSDSELYDIAKQAMTRKTVPGNWWGTRELPAAYEATSVPDAERASIIAGWKKVNPREKGSPPESEILRLYRIRLAGNPQ